MLKERIGVYQMNWHRICKLGAQGAGNHKENAAIAGKAKEIV